MPDRKRSLHEVLGEFHEVLEASSDLSDEERADLAGALDEIRGVLDGSDEPRRPEGLIDRLRGALEGFEDRHPRLTEIVGRVADQLSDLGI